MSKEIKILLVVLVILDALAINAGLAYLWQRKTTVASEPVVQTQYMIVYQTAPKTKTRTTSYVTIPGSGSTTETAWTNVAGSEFYFNPADYPGLVSVYFEANMKLFNGSGLAYAQLFDVTHGIGVQGSEVSTQTGSDTVVESGQVSFWSGRNLIRVQVKSLTTESAIFNSGRLRILTEN
ncbi:MAG: hypothetical protein UU32_C0051G0009 [Candidatus Woesebacteria bacterium GW2011_GWB1_41_10]|uniref:Uncharacterized protein n=1 Tax=Candidatus Woesebacteria bacterium GW2011_GWB1_41_10 TaxID=1618577 RepID=A0A0G0U4M1_9BACT|nr:MAG: hypothetical protein UU32_C0051G0009 [Candidatus Woesebacteria bacterium GW2011_GWB1_41_10]